MFAMMTRMMPNSCMLGGILTKRNDMLQIILPDIQHRLRSILDYSSNARLFITKFIFFKYIS